MKVLVVATPGSGHVNPLVPLVSALVDAGDRVVIASAPEASPRVAGSGAEFFPAGHDEAVWFERLKERTRGFPGDGLPPERINHYFLPRLFGELAAADMVDDVLACGRELGPDLVLFESYALAGPLVADLLGVPCVQHQLGPLLDPQILVLANDAVSPLWRSFGRDVPGLAGVYGEATVTVCPPSLEPRPVPSGRTLPLRPAPLPEAGAGSPSRPLVYLTLGTFFNANLDAFRPILAGLAELPVDVVVTVGRDQDPTALGPVPANARVERFIPQGTLLPTCSAVVHHGGAGTTFGALAHGLPQVVVPQGADNFVNAEMLERGGQAVVIRPGEVTPERVADAVLRVLDEPGFATAARLTAQEIAAMPGPAEVAEQIRALRRG